MRKDLNEVVKKENEVSELNEIIDTNYFYRDLPNPEKKVMNYIIDNYFIDYAKEDIELDEGLDEVFENNINKLIKPNFKKYLGYTVLLSLIFSYAISYLNALNVSTQNSKILALIAVIVIFFLGCYNYYNHVKTIKLFRKLAFYEIIMQEDFILNLVVQDSETAELLLFYYSKAMETKEELIIEQNKLYQEIDISIEKLEKDFKNVEYKSIDGIDLSNFGEKILNFYIMNSKRVIQNEQSDDYFITNKDDIIMFVLDSKNKNKSMPFNIKIDENYSEPQIIQQSKDKVTVNRTILMNKDFYQENILDVVLQNQNISRNIKTLLKDKIKDL